MAGAAALLASSTGGSQRLVNQLPEQRRPRRHATRVSNPPLGVNPLQLLRRDSEFQANQMRSENFLLKPEPRSPCPPVQLTQWLRAPSHPRQFQRSGHQRFRTRLQSFVQRIERRKPRNLAALEKQPKTRWRKTRWRWNRFTVVPSAAYALQRPSDRPPRLCR